MKMMEEEKNEKKQELSALWLVRRIDDLLHQPDFKDLRRSVQYMLLLIFGGEDARPEMEVVLHINHAAAPRQSTLHIAKNQKTSVVKLIYFINMLHLLEDDQGDYPNITTVMAEFSMFLGEDLTDYNKLIANARERKTYTDVFQRLLDLAREDFNK